ncbi:hypothetical protein GCM10010519_47200 [Streptomyces lactacystinicus]
MGISDDMPSCADPDLRAREAGVPGRVGTSANGMLASRHGAMQGSWGGGTVGDRGDEGARGGGADGFGGLPAGG